jgi:hypothetical protein
MGINSLTDDIKQADNSYKEFGADVMITDDLKIKLIEINDRPGHNLRGKSDQGIADCDPNFTNYIFQWTMDTVIIPVYNSHHRQSVDLYYSTKHDREPIYKQQISS